MHAGYSWQDASGTFNDGGSPISLNSLDLNGAIIGGQLGYNVQSGWWMVGIEGDGTANLESGSVNTGASAIQLNSDVSYLASLRGRLGFVISNVLIYGTGGVGFADMQFTENATAFYGRLRKRETGAVYGGGIEWPIVHGVTMRGEYLHYDVGSTISIPTTFTNAASGDFVRFNDIDVARAGLNISLSP